MPQYFFDYSVGESELRDQVGTMLSGPEEAEREAKGMLMDLVQTEWKYGQVSATVRDELGRAWFQATIRFKAERIAFG